MPMDSVYAYDWPPSSFQTDNQCMPANDGVDENHHQVRIYHPRQRDEGVVETDGLDGEGSRAKQEETEGSKGLASEESTKEGQWRGRRVRSEGSIEFYNNYEREYQSKRRLSVRRNWRKRSGPSSMVENTEVERRSNGSNPSGVRVFKGWNKMDSFGKGSGEWRIDPNACFGLETAAEYMLVQAQTNEAKTITHSIILSKFITSLPQNFQRKLSSINPSTLKVAIDIAVKM
ncbi:hypothetical protein NPIL_70881, partial [Nephila pilipes]